MIMIITITIVITVGSRCVISARDMIGVGPSQGLIHGISIDQDPEVGRD
jgi:hypothetical protein